MKNVEIERKWLLDTFPDLPLLAEYEMEQGYLAFEPNTVRIRKTLCQGQAEHMLCIKGKGLEIHAEIEVPISPEQYSALSALLGAPAARKRLRTYRLPGGEVLECNLVDEGEADSFMYAEVEFESVEAANAFVPPVFLGREVTNVPGHTMADFCRRKGCFEK